MRDRWERMNGAHKAFSSIFLLISSFDGVMLFGDYMHGEPQIWVKAILTSMVFLAGLVTLIRGLAMAPPPAPSPMEHSPDRGKRARALLLSHLSESQKEQYLTEKTFWAMGESGSMYVLNGNKGDYYRVRTERGEKLCISGYDTVGREFDTPYMKPPREDELLAIKLMIETDEQRFLAKANNHGLPVRLPAPPPPDVVGVNVDVPMNVYNAQRELERARERLRYIEGLQRLR